MSIDTKGGKEAFAAGASQSSRNGMTGHSNDHQTMAFSAPPQVGLKPTLTNAAQRTNVRKSGDGQNVPKPKRVLPRVFLSCRANRFQQACPSCCCCRQLEPGQPRQRLRGIYDQPVSADRLSS